MDKFNITILILIVAVIVVGVAVVVLYDQPKPIADIVPIETESEKRIIERKIKSEVLESEIDTSDWQTYKNTIFNYSVKIPPGFNNVSEYDGEIISMPETYEFPLVLENDKKNNIRLIPLQRFTESSGNSIDVDRFERKITLSDFQSYKVNGLTFQKSLIEQEQFFIANDDLYFQFMFLNVDKETMNAFLGNFSLE